MREMRTIGRPFNAELEVYSECKYTASAEALENSKKVRYSGITAWEIVTGEDAEEILKETDYTCVDDNNEYLVLYFENGETSTYRNSYVDMFRI